MTTIALQREVHCPYVRALQYVDTYLAQLGWSERSHSVSLRMRVPINRLSDGEGLTLDKAVVATLSRSAEQRPLEDRIDVTWQPDVDGEPFPLFCGLFSIRAATPTASIVALAGEYEPPFGTAGKIFDAAFGHRIAKATAREFLKDIAARIELGYAQDEPHLCR